MPTPDKDVLNQTTRKREKNYTAEEEVLLVKLVNTRKNCIENKKSDAVIWRQKQDAWRKVAEEFAAISGIHRHWKGLRDKYEIIKRRSRSEMSDQNVESSYNAGGGSSAGVSTVSAKMASMLGDSAAAFQNIYDNDSLIEPYVVNCVDLDSSLDNVDQKPNNYAFFKEDISIEETTGLSNWGPRNIEHKISGEMLVGVKRKIEDEKVKLIILQQKFYRDENTRAQERHEQELLSLKLKNEILQLELAEKKSKTA